MCKKREDSKVPPIQFYSIHGSYSQFGFHSKNCTIFTPICSFFADMFAFWLELCEPHVLAKQRFTLKSPKKQHMEKNSARKYTRNTSLYTSAQGKIAHAALLRNANKPHKEFIVKCHLVRCEEYQF